MKLQLVFLAFFLCVTYSVASQSDDGFIQIDGNSSSSSSDDGLKNKIRGRITYANRAWNGQFPYHAILSIQVADGGWVTCGGTLIKADHVLTAAHCLPSGLRAIEANFGTNDRKVGGTKVNGVAYIQHGILDVAVFRLATSVNFELVYLPSRSFASSGFNYIGARMTAIGFGGDETGNISRYLLWTFMFGTSSNECGSTADKILCTKGETLSQLRGGDSGSALLLGNTIVGVASYIVGERNGFVRLDTLLDWISARIDVPIN